MFLPCSLASGKTMLGVMVAMVTSFQKTVVVSALTLQQDTANPGLCQRLLETHRQVCLNLLWGHCSFLSISCGVTAPFSLSRVGSLLLSLYLLWGHCSFLLGPGAHKILFVPSKSLFSSPAEVLQTNPTGLQSQISRGFSVPLPDIQVGESVVGPRTFATM